MLLGRENEQLEEAEQTLSLGELTAQLQDIENRLPPRIEPNSNQVPMKFLSSSATLAQVISAVNELIKRDASVNRVE